MRSFVVERDLERGLVVVRVSAAGVECLYVNQEMSSFNLCEVVVRFAGRIEHILRCL